MRFERFHFGLIGVCLFFGAVIGGALAGRRGLGGMAAGTMVGLMVATSLLETNAE